jgi:hypothetical protein
MTKRGRTSFEKFNYLLRPSKQVERKIFLEVLNRLRDTGLGLSGFTYFGLGSVYYADFILFHKYLYINDMICVEREPIPNRMRFNRPFHFIKLQMEAVSDVIPNLDRDGRYLAWLDYDAPLSSDILGDVRSLTTVLEPGSILVVTVEADPRLLISREDGPTDEGRRQSIIARFRGEFGRYYPAEIDESLLGAVTLRRFLASVLVAALEQYVDDRDGLQFLRLFNYTYADGAQMVTVGGMIGNPALRATLKEGAVYKLPFVTRRRVPTSIEVPPLTTREVYWLDQNPRASLKTIRRRFEIDREFVEHYRRVGKYYPAYYEALF